MTYNDCTITLMYNHNQYYTSISYFKQQKRVDRCKDCTIQYNI